MAASRTLSASPPGPTILDNLPQRSPRRYTASDTDAKLTTLLETAQREPVFIERGQQEVAVLVSARDYDRLSGKRPVSSMTSATKWPSKPPPMA